jgi:hypothetical protein
MKKKQKKLDPTPAAIHISVDEVSYRKYYRYLTNVIDTDKRGSFDYKLQALYLIY